MTPEREKEIRDLLGNAHVFDVTMMIVSLVGAVSDLLKDKREADQLIIGMRHVRDVQSGNISKLNDQVEYLSDQLNSKCKEVDQLKDLNVKLQLGGVRPEIALKNRGLEDKVEILEQRIAQLHSTAVASTARVNELLQNNEYLRNAIRKHRDEKGDDRCYLDDYELYKALDEPIPYSACQLAEPCEQIRNCANFIAKRHDDKKPYLSPNKFILELKAKLVRFRAECPFSHAGDGFQKCVKMIEDYEKEYK